MRPRNAIEKQLVALWKEALCQPEIGIRDRFGDLGGNSLLSMKVAARVRKAFAVEVPLCTFFGDVTIQDQAQAILAATGSASRPVFPEVRRVSRDGDIPASFSQERVRFLQLLYPHCTAYHFVGLLWLDAHSTCLLWKRALAPLCDAMKFIGPRFR